MRLAGRAFALRSGKSCSRGQGNQMKRVLTKAEGRNRAGKLVRIYLVNSGSLCSSRSWRSSAHGVSVRGEVHARVTRHAENGVSDLVENRRRAVLHHANLFCYDVLLSQTSCSWPSGGSIARPPAEKRKRQLGALPSPIERRP